MTEIEEKSSVPEPNFNTLTHAGTYATKIEKRDNGDIILVQSNKHGVSDCVILPRDLAQKLARFILVEQSRRVA